MDGNKGKIKRLLSVSKCFLQVIYELYLIITFSGMKRTVKICHSIVKDVSMAEIDYHIFLYLLYITIR